MSSPTPQFKSIDSLALSLLYGPTVTFIHDWMTGKTIALTIWTFVSKVMSLLFNMLFRVLKCDVGNSLFKAYGCMFYYSYEQKNILLLIIILCSPA